MADVDEGLNLRRAADTNWVQKSASKSFPLAGKLGQSKETLQTLHDEDLSPIDWLDVKNSENVKETKNMPPNNGRISMDNLPSEVLVHVLSFLDVKERIRSELVCKRWRLIGKELPWRNPTKFVFSRNAKKSSLRISIMNLTDDILLAILRRCGTCMKHLMLTSTYSHTVRLTGKSIGTIGQGCPNLEIIKLHIPVNSACLKNISNGCPKLKVMKIFNFGNIDYEEGVLEIARNCKALECLAVSDLCLSDKWFIGVNRKLKILRFDKCTLMPSGVKNLITYCDSLEELELAAVLQMGLAEDMLFKIFDHFKRTLKIVKILCLGVVEDMNWCIGLKVLLNLEELTLHHCLSVDDRLMAILAEHCTKLRMLSIAGTNVTDEGVRVLKSLTRLKVLDVSNIEMSGVGLNILAMRGALEKVYLKGMMEIEEENFCSLAKLCPNLRLVDVSGTWQITNQFVEAFCNATNKGFFRGTVKLIVGHTSVTKRVDTCEGLERGHQCKATLRSRIPEHLRFDNCTSVRATHAKFCGLCGGSGVCCDPVSTSTRLEEFVCAPGGEHVRLAVMSIRRCRCRLCHVQNEEEGLVEEEEDGREVEGEEEEDEEAAGVLRHPHHQWPADS